SRAASALRADRDRDPTGKSAARPGRDQRRSLPRQFYRLSLLGRLLWHWDLAGHRTRLPARDDRTQPIWRRPGARLSLGSRLDVEPDGEPLKARVRRRIAPQHERIVPRDDVADR